jgi:hypothetical protein
MLVCGIMSFGLLTLDRVRSAQADVGYTPADVEHSVSLDKIRGYVQASLALWKSADYKLAAAHAAAANAEFATISNDLAAQNANAALQTALDAYTTMVAQAGDAAKMDAAYQDVLDATDTAEQALVGSNLTDTQFLGEVSVKLVQSVETEYTEALQDGKIAEPAKYGNAVAFLQVAQVRWDVISAGLENPDSAAKVKAQFDILKVDLPDYVKLPAKPVSPDILKKTVDTLIDALRSLLDLPPSTQEPTASAP